MRNPCIIPGCRGDGIWQLGVRARLIAKVASPSHPTKRATDAAFAPNLPAFLCDKHAFSGCLVTVIVEPRKYGETRVRALGAPNPQPHRTVKIR